MSQDPQKINVVLSGTQSTSVRHPSNSNQVTVTQQGKSTSVVSSTPQPNLQVGFLGVQGADGSLQAKGSDGAIQYNRDGYVSGAKGFFYYPENTKLTISDKDLVLGTGNIFILSGVPADENAFLLRDSSKNILRVDTENKRISLSEGGTNNYYVGIGLQDPKERVHIANGNLRVDGNMLVSGNILPLLSGQYDLGSSGMPFKDLYLQGDSLYFVDKKAVIRASNTGFSFQFAQNDGTNKEVFAISDQGSIKLGGEGVYVDGTQITGVPYTGLTDAGAFVSQAVASGASSVAVNYGKTLAYDPKVVCAINPPENSQEQYFTFVQGVGRSSCTAVFSDKISGNGFILSCHISPRNSVF